MCFFKKKTADKARVDRELVETNSKAIEALMILAKNNDELIDSLKELQEKLKYLVPSENSTIFDYDKSIKNKIDDLRIVLSKSDGGDSRKIFGLITDIKCLVADRNVKL